MRLYKIRELAEMLGVTERTVRKLLKSGKLEGSKICGKWIITEEQLKKLIKNN